VCRAGAGRERRGGGMVRRVMRGQTVVVGGGGARGARGGVRGGRVGARVVVVTGRLDTIGQTPCNPSVGGVAKGHLVKEIEALGGFMGRAADACAIHGRILNRSKGPAVRATRVQVDKARYGAYAQAALTHIRGSRWSRGWSRACGRDRSGASGWSWPMGPVAGEAVVVTTGTFLGGVLHTGASARRAGGSGRRRRWRWPRHLRALGFALRRLKTGTPARLDGRTIDYADLEELQPSEDPAAALRVAGRRPAADAAAGRLSPDVDDRRDARGGARAPARVGDVLGGDHRTRAALLPVDRGQGGALRRQASAIRCSSSRRGWTRTACTRTGCRRACPRRCRRRSCGRSRGSSARRCCGPATRSSTTRSTRAR
jgi:hypothetical protein